MCCLQQALGSADFRCKASTSHLPSPSPTPASQPIYAFDCGRSHAIDTQSQTDGVRRLPNQARSRRWSAQDPQRGRCHPPNENGRSMSAAYGGITGERPASVRIEADAT